MVRFGWSGAIALALSLVQPLFAADNGNGTFTNPPLFADFPDPDIIRVGVDFYMVSTTFVNSPGLAVLHSNDLINWTTIGNVVDRLAGDARYDMNGGTLYRNGVFAPSIRYKDGTFYVAVQPNGTGQGLQIYHTQDPAGSWQLNELNGGAFDPGLFIDTDGTPYVVYGGAYQNNLYIRQLTPNLDGFATSQQIIATNSFGLEGSHVAKKGNYHYMFNARPSNLSMYVSRSTSLLSGWTNQQLLTDGSGSGHQGGIVDLENGDWYGFAMRDSGPVGRMTNMSPVAWVNDWPVWGNNNVVPGTAPKPILGQPIAVQPTSADFNDAELLPDWRWNHNPDDARWSLSERPGYLRLKPTVAPDFWNARNTLTYKGFGPTSEAVVEMDISRLATGDVAGLGMLGKGLANLSVNRLASGDAQLVLSTGTATASSGPLSQQATASLGEADNVYLLLKMNFQVNQGQTAYSLDGQTWNTIGGTFPLQWDWATGTFQGEQFAIYNYNSTASSGYVDVNRATFIQRADLNRDGSVDASDYQRFLAYHSHPLPGSAPIATFAYGDLDGDLDNDFNDFRAFQANYIAIHGASAFSAMVASLGQAPEPGTAMLMLMGAATITSCSRRRRFARNVYSTSHR